MVFLHYSQAELDRQYDQRAWAKNAVEVLGRCASASDAARRELDEPSSIAYGARPSETFDLYRSPSPDAPIHIFIHGGAWRMLDKRVSAFSAPMFVKAGAHFIAPDFDLLPNTTLAGMVDQVRRCVAFVYTRAREFGGDPSRIHISGHSSGAHLAACVAVTDWAAFGLPADTIKSVVCVSGMYDLLPVRLSARNDYVRLDEATEHALSPIRHLKNLTAPVFVGYGSLETDEFRRQGREFAAALGNSLAFKIELQDLNHFETAEAMADPHRDIGRAALRLMGLG